MQNVQSFLLWCFFLMGSAISWSAEDPPPTSKRLERRLPRPIHFNKKLLEVYENPKEPLYETTLKIWRAFRALYPNETFICDEELIRNFYLSLKFKIKDNTCTTYLLDSIQPILKEASKTLIIYKSRLPEPTQQSDSEKFYIIEDILAYIERLFTLYYVEKAISPSFSSPQEDSSLEGGKRGKQAVTLLPEEARETINNLIGRIFAVVNEEKKKGEVSSSIIWTGSGMLSPPTKEGDSCNEVITCKHVTTPIEGSQNISFYFVRGVEINPETGWPENCFTREDVINFLINPSNQGRVVSKILLSTQERDPSQDNSPSESFKDGMQVLSLKSPFIGIPTNVRVHKLTDKEAERKLIAESGPQKYYAIGYPVTSYLGSVEMPGWMLSLGLAPLTITSSTHKMSPHSSFTLEHGAPTSQGMSGGPIILFDQAQRVLWVGVIGTGEINVEYAQKDKFLFTFPDEM